MPPKKTNSNSITSILVVALNSDQEFKKTMLDLFSERIYKKIDERVQFYDCTHSPLLYPEMNGKSIDIIARIPGKHKPEIMIEVKANIGETLQNSQKADGEYYETARNHDIPLIYIIPKDYIHKNDLPKESKKQKPKVARITWEEILGETQKINIPFGSQIDQFVEISESQENISDDERKLLENTDLLVKIHNLEKSVLSIIDSVLTKNTDRQKEESQWGVGYYYSIKNPPADYYIGFNPYCTESKYFLAFDVAENCNNVDLGDRPEKPLYFEEGYYYLPILGSEFLDNNDIIAKQMSKVKKIRDKLKELKISSIDNDVRDNFPTYFLLKTKVGETFENIFEEESGKIQINEKKYEEIKKIYKINNFIDNFSPLSRFDSPSRYTYLIPTEASLRNPQAEGVIMSNTKDEVRVSKNFVNLIKENEGLFYKTNRLLDVKI